jgi:outer membrane protein assembly factor BamB
MNCRRRQLLAGAGSLGIAGLSGCLGVLGDDDRSLSVTPAGTWYQSGCDARNTFAPDVAVPDRGTPVWNGGDASTIPPLVAGETTYTVGDSLTALHAATGDRRWQAELGSESPSPGLAQPAVTDERVVLASEGRLRSFARDDGSTQWDRPVDGIPTGPVTTTPDDRIGIVSVERPRADGSAGERPLFELVGVDLSSGETAWTTQFIASGTPPAIRDGRVYARGYAGDDRAVVRCVAVDGGAHVWDHELDNPRTPPVAADAGVLVGDAGSIAVVDPATGERRRSVDVTAREIRAIAVADGTVFALTADGLHAVSTADGTARWAVDGAPRANGLAVGREAVVAPIASDRFDLETNWPCVAAFDRRDGTVRWYHAVDDTFDPVVGAPVIAAGVVFVVTNTESGVTALGDLPPATE